MSVKCEKGCGRETNNKTGVCTICANDIFLNGAGGAPVEQGKEIKTMAAGCKNEIEGKQCGRAIQKEGLCYACFKAKHGAAPYGPKTVKELPKKKDSGQAGMTDQTRPDQTRYSYC